MQYSGMHNMTFGSHLADSATITETNRIHLVLFGIQNRMDLVGGDPACHLESFSHARPKVGVSRSNPLPVALPCLRPLWTQEHAHAPLRGLMDGWTDCRQTDTDRQTDRQSDGRTDGQAGRQEAGRRADRQTDRQAGRRRAGRQAGR
jgi:hypothetical protein